MELLEPLSIWVDHMLQKVVHLCPTYFVDSWCFLNTQPEDLNNCRLLTVDTKAMHSSINTDHAMESKANWFEFHDND